jgi:tRNA isopentenyl-2-thiomethyl-A-37 hydroxylase MiaE
MEKETKLGKNRTGMQASPSDSKELLQGSERSMPTTEGDEGALAAVRGEYVKEADALGSVPPPATMKGMLKTTVQMVTGNRAQVFVDKLGERLAFERGGTRLYETLIMKCLARQAETGQVVNLRKLQEIHDEELRHFHLVRQAIEDLGGDPTAMTPCADLVGVQSMGLVQAMNEPRTTLAQDLNTALVAELADNAGWELLITLARELGQDELAESFTTALAKEQDHLATIKNWLEQLTIADAKVLAPTT